MPKISLTDFVDFVIKSGTPKLTKVRSIKQRPEYQPAFDFWKPLRDRIQQLHSNGTFSKSELQKIVGDVANSRKVGRYRKAVKGYSKFIGTRQVSWFEPLSGKWVHQGLEVRVNPELGLKIGSDSYLIKLYFKEDAPTRNRVTVVLDMMDLVLAGKVPPGTKMAVLDVTNGKLMTETRAAGGAVVLLQGEAAAFLEMWKRL